MNRKSFLYKIGAAIVAFLVAPFASFSKKPKRKGFLKGTGSKDGKSTIISDPELPWVAIVHMENGQPSLPPLVKCGSLEQTIGPDGRLVTNGVLDCDPGWNRPAPHYADTREWDKKSLQDRVKHLFQS